MRLRFCDGVVRDVEYVPQDDAGSLVRPLRDPAYFAQVAVDHEARTVVWPNGLDLAPDVLHGAHDANNPLGFRDVTPPALLS